MPDDQVTSLKELMAAWRPLNDLHRAGGRYSTGVHLRLHRCFSWAQRAEASDQQEDVDVALILRSIAFNSLWARQWRPGERKTGDHATWAQFLVDMANHDETRRSRMLQMMQNEAELFRSIYENQFSNRDFWCEPAAEGLARTHETAAKAERWLEEGNLRSLLWEFAPRILLIRGQLVHGNASHGGSLNRKTLQTANLALDLTLRVVLEILIFDDGHQQDFQWEPVPYPPDGEFLPDSPGTT